jgi:hypothetical protein
MGVGAFSANAMSLVVDTRQFLLTAQYRQLSPIIAQT